MKNKVSFFPRVEWSMCSADEADDRERYNEISIFECSNPNDTTLVNPKLRKSDPYKCIKKYRRSAAGGGVEGYNSDNSSYRRSFEDLDRTVNYLLGIIFSTQTTDEKSGFRASLLQTVLFIDDRIRAVQVDLTTLMGKGMDNFRSNISLIRKIQLKILRYHLLSQHLLSNLSTKKYEWKFGQKALTTAITSYFATWDVQNENNSAQDHMDLDEVMCYSSLLHVASIINSRETSIQSYNCTVSKQKWCGLTCEDGHGMSAILSLYRKYGSFVKRGFVNNDSSIPLSSFPKYQWALRIAADVETGNYLSVIRLLKTEASDENYFLNKQNKWKILARCCMAQAMPTLRIGLLRCYNKGFMKEEKVKDHDLANLCHLPNPEATIRFCNNVGLPINTDVETACIIMKAAPICIRDFEGDKEEVIRQLINPGRDEDHFVFGPFQTKWLTKTENTSVNDIQKMSSLQRALANIKIGEQKLNDQKQQGGRDLTVNEWSVSGLDNTIARTDEDGVMILPSVILRQLLFQ